MLNAVIASFAATASSVTSAGIFRPDREFLFQSCAVMHGYDVASPYGPSVARGKWVFSEKRQQGADVVLDAWAIYGDSDPTHLAYVLATARRESAGTFSPVREAPVCGGDEGCRERAIGRLLQKRADKRNAVRAEKGMVPLPVRENYAMADKYGRRYYGRGFNQLTGARNYEYAGRLIGLDLLESPDKVIEPSVSARILIEGMLKGWFGKRKPLSYYLDDPKLQWNKARDTTNPGTPNASITGSYARDFLKCLRPANP